MKLTTSLRMTSCLLKTIKQPMKFSKFKHLSSLPNASQSEFSPSKIDWPKQMSDELESSFVVINDFINEAEESALIKEVEPHLKRLVYEKDHWDEAIVGFRETERKQWNQVNSVLDILQYLRAWVSSSSRSSSMLCSIVLPRTASSTTPTYKSTFVA